MGKEIAKQKVIDLNYNKNYSYDELLEFFTRAYVDDTNRPFFDKSFVFLGNLQGKIFSDFKVDGEPLKFWDFAKRLRDGGKRLTMALLTQEIDFNQSNMTKKNHQATETDENSINDKKSISQTPDFRTSVKKSTQADSKVITDKDKKQASPSINRANEESQKRSSIIDLSSESSPVYSDLNTLKNREKKSQFKRPLTSPVKKNPPKTIKKFDKITLDVPVIPFDEIVFPDKEDLGKGGQGTVRKGVHDFTNYAVKSVCKNNYDNKLTLREILILSKVKHENFIRILAVSETPREYHICMELFTCNSLNDVIFNRAINYRFNLTVKQRHNIAFQTSLAINYLHKPTDSKPTIYHADIKPSNILVSHYLVDGNFYIVKICDFGLSKFINIDTMLRTTANGAIGGTWPFMAPEILVLKKQPSQATDVWALACSLKELYAEERVWGNISDPFEMNICLRNNQILELPEEKFQMGVLSLLTKAFDYNPEKRPSTSELVEFFNYNMSTEW